MSSDKSIQWQIELLAAAYEIELARLEGKKGYEHNKANRKRHDRVGFLGRMLARKYGGKVVETLKENGREKAQEHFDRYNPRK